MTVVEAKVLIETCFLCGGHFVLEEQSLHVSLLIKSFFGRLYSWPAPK
ncbi:hypothetical protein [Desulfosporosinus sp. SB140]